MVVVDVPEQAGLLPFLRGLVGYADTSRHVLVKLNEAGSAVEAGQALEAAGQPSLPHHQTIIKRELKHVPTPWGWPGSDVRQGGLGDRSGGNGSLQAWIDHLVSEKRTVDDDLYQSRKDASLRALLEDRYGRPAKPGEVEYRRVKPPLLRDPGRPYDQEDNFPSGRTGQILDGLSRQPGKPSPAQSAPGMRKAGGLKDVKTPWGW